MALCYATFTSVHALGGSTVYSKATPRTEAITTSGSSSISTLAARTGEIVRVTAVGGLIAVAVVKSGAVTVATGTPLIDGGVIEFAGLSDGDKIAAIDIV